MKTIKFKSTPENWRKEYLGLKNNTLRTFDNLEDSRLEVIDGYLNNKWNLINVEIVNTETGEVFKREVRDITRFGSYYIITWNTLKQKMTNTEELIGIEFQLKEMNRLKAVEIKLKMLELDIQLYGKPNSKLKNDYINELFEIMRDFK